jgi:hypothetical protein
MKKINEKVRSEPKAPPEKLNNKVFAPFYFDTKNYWFYYTEIRKE